MKMFMVDDIGEEKRIEIVKVISLDFKLVLETHLVLELRTTGGTVTSFNLGSLLNKTTENTEESMRRWVVGMFNVLGITSFDDAKGKHVILFRKNSGDISHISDLTVDNVFYVLE